MHTEITTIKLLFKCTIFSLLAYKIYDLFITHLLPLLKEQLFSEKKQQTEILEKERLFMSTKQRIENQIYNQKQMFIHLERNVQAWHNNILTDREALEQTNKSVVETIENKRKKQKENISLFFDVHMSCPEALKQARDELIRKYQSEDGKKNFSTLLATLPNNPLIKQ